MRHLALLVLVACSSGPPAAPPVPEAPKPVAQRPAPPPPEQIAEPNRPLTTGEVAMLKPIFRDGIDYAKVRVINNSFPLQPENIYMTPRGHVYAPGRLFREDFAAADAYVRAVFVHEMTHVWQHANGMDLIGQSVVEFTKHRGAYEKAYPYELVQDRDLAEYGMEQQASIVEDYYLVTVVKDHPQRMTNRELSAAQRDVLYAAVLKNFLGNARYAQALDPRHVADKHAKESEKTPPGPEACKESEAEHGAAHMCSWRYEPRKKP